MRSIDENGHIPSLERSIKEWLTLIDEADNAHCPHRRASYCDALIEVLRETFTDDRLEAICTAEREGPKPLTLAEMKERVGKKYVWRKAKKQARPIVITEIDDKAIHYMSIGFSECWTSIDHISSGAVMFFDHEPKESEEQL